MTLMTASLWFTASTCGGTEGPAISKRLAGTPRILRISLFTPVFKGLLA